MDDKIIRVSDLKKVPMFNGKYDKKNANEHFIYGIECVMEYIDNMPAIEVIPKGAYDQVRWERDIAIEQLNSYGVQFGEKADVQKVKHGKIIETIKDGKMNRVFSCCGEDFTNLTMWLIPNYCPNCGAKMDKEE